MLSSHPRALTPVCSTELGYMGQIKPDFRPSRGQDHRHLNRSGRGQPRVDAAQCRIAVSQGAALNYPIIADTDHAISKAHEMRPCRRVRGSDRPDCRAERRFAQRFRHWPGQEDQARAHLSGDDRARLDEVLRMIDSLQLTVQQQLRKPAQWQPGQSMIIAGSVSDEDTARRYPGRTGAAVALHAHR